MALGANLIANCWGPAVGAKVLSCRTALVVGLICQSAGVLAFGPGAYTVYSGYLDHWEMVEPYPRLTMYTLMWMVVTPVIWEALAIWQMILLPAHLGLGQHSLLPHTLIALKVSVSCLVSKKKSGQ